MKRIQTDFQRDGIPPDNTKLLASSSAGSLDKECESASGTPASTERNRPGHLDLEMERLVIEHLPVVRYIARHIHERLPPYVPLDDLYSAGVMGLMDACGKFDASKRIQFKTYAQFRIRGAILDSLRTLDWSPRELRRQGRAIEQAIRILSVKLGRAPDEMEIAQELSLNLPAYQQLLNELKGLEIGSLYSERAGASDEDEVVYLSNRPEDDPLFCCMRSEIQQRLTDAIDDLPARERVVITLYYYEEMTMKEISVVLGVVESRVSQIRLSAVLHLRARLADKGFERDRSRARPGKG